MRKSFLELDSSFFEKWLCPREKNFEWEKIFKIDIFVLKYVLNHYKLIPTNFFFEKFSIFLVTFCHFWAQKYRFYEFLGENFWNFFHPFHKDCNVVILRYYLHPYAIELCRLTRFIEFLTKNDQK